MVVYGILMALSISMVHVFQPCLMTPEGRHMELAGELRLYFNG